MKSGARAQAHPVIISLRLNAESSLFNIIYAPITRPQSQMPVDAETIFVDAINIMVFAHIDPIAIMISIRTPYKIMPPQIFVSGIIIGKERICAKNCRWEIQFLTN